MLDQIINGIVLNNERFIKGHKYDAKYFKELIDKSSKYKELTVLLKRNKKLLDVIYNYLCHLFWKVTIKIFQKNIT